MRVRRRRLAPGTTQGGIQAARGPRGRYDGDTGGRMAVLETLWWEYCRKHGGVEDYVVGGAWRYRGQYGGSTGRRMAMLGTIWWKCSGTHGGSGGNVVGVLGDALRY